MDPRDASASKNHPVYVKGSGSLIVSKSRYCVDWLEVIGGNNEGDCGWWAIMRVVDVGDDKSHVRADVGRGGGDGGHEVDSGVHGGCL